MLGTALRTAHLAITRARFQLSDVKTPSFMHLTITFRNQKFSICSRNVDGGFVTSDSFCGNSLQNEYSCLLSPVLR
jgi:hypothetical protein